MPQQPGQLPSLLGWQLARPHVRLARDAGDLDLLDLCERAGRVEPHRPIEEHLHHVHLACNAIGAGLLGPWVCDGIMLSVDPRSLGIRLDHDRPDTVWVEGPTHARMTADQFGRSCAALLDPLVDVIARRTGRSRRTILRMATDRLVGEVTRLRSHVDGHVDHEQITDFLHGIDPGARTPRSIAVHPDDGPPVQLHAPRVCCVLSRDLSPDACPTCPRYPSDTHRIDAAKAWLRTVDDARFHELTGRARAS